MWQKRWKQSVWKLTMYLNLQLWDNSLRSNLPIHTISTVSTARRIKPHMPLYGSARSFVRIVLLNISVYLVVTNIVTSKMFTMSTGMTTSSEPFALEETSKFSRYSRSMISWMRNLPTNIGTLALVITNDHLLQRWIECHLTRWSHPRIWKRDYFKLSSNSWSSLKSWVKVFNRWREHFNKISRYMEDRWAKTCTILQRMFHPIWKLLEVRFSRICLDLLGR